LGNVRNAFVVSTARALCFSRMAKQLEITVRAKASRTRGAAQDRQWQHRPDQQGRQQRALTIHFTLRQRHHPEGLMLFHSQGYVGSPCQTRKIRAVSVERSTHSSKNRPRDVSAYARISPEAGAFVVTCALRSRPADAQNQRVPACFTSKLDCAGIPNRQAITRSMKLQPILWIDVAASYWMRKWRLARCSLIAGAIT